MAILSNNAQKALEQVKNGLLVLYGADYFSDAEWFRVDQLIHKGRYVFTHGPASHMLDEPLMDFAETTQEVSMPIEACERKEKVNTLVVEQTEPTSSDINDSSNSESGPPTFSSTELSADEEAMPAPSRITTPALSEPPKVPLLPTGYTQAQLEESKAFRSQVKVKAHHYSEPQKSSWGTHPIDQADSEFPLPTETLVSSWASQIGEPDDTTSLQQSISTLALHDETPRTRPHSVVHSSPKPTKEYYYNEFVKKYGRAPTSLGDYWQPNNPEYRGPNPSPLPKYARSVASTASSQRKRSTTASGTAPSYSIFPIGFRSEDIVIGAMYIATHAQMKTSKVVLEVSAGDQLKILNLVSGMTYMCQNLETGLRGQFKGSMLKPWTNSAMPTRSNSIAQNENFTRAFSNEHVPATVSKQMTELERSLADESSENLREVASSSQAPGLVGKNNASSWGIAPSIDMIETLNAAEWNDEPAPRSTPVPVWKASEQRRHEPEQDQAWESVSARRAKRAMPLSPTQPSGARPLAPPATLLTSPSRFSVLAEESSTTTVTPAMQAAINRGVREALGDQMDNIRQTFSPAIKPFTPSTSRSSKYRKDSESQLIPKTNTCWFWATNKGCRFTDEECRDLHSHTNALGEPTNFHNGKPTWGAAADYSRTAPSIADGSYEGEPKTFTCWFWAQKGKCMHSDEECKFAHEQTPGGIARPRGWKQPVREPWRKIGESSWRAGSSEAGAENGNGAWGDEKEQAADSGDNWGAEQPAHVQDLQTRLEQEEVGW